MNEISVSSLDQLESRLRSEFDRSHFIYRGVSQYPKHTLRPKIGRKVDGHQPYKRSRERGLFDRFKQYAALHMTASPSSDWDWLALAQHHGLPTRLLDWSLNPMVATWFSLQGKYSLVKRSKRDRDTATLPSLPAAIYVCKLPRWVDTKKVRDPFGVKDVVSFLPSHVSRRITAQSGLFTVHPDPPTDWDDSALSAIILNFDERSWRQATRHLLRFGMHQYSLFPDLDGLTANLTMLYVRGFNLAYGKPAEQGGGGEDE